MKEKLLLGTAAIIASLAVAWMILWFVFDLKSILVYIVDLL